MATEFTPKQLTEFSQIKRFIKSHTQSVVQWGEQLDRVRICEYWKMDGAASFRAWCEENVPLPWNAIKWALQKEAARLPEHAGEEIKKANVKESEVNLGMPPYDTNNVYKDVSSPPSIPAKPKPKEKILDSFGVPIPEPCIGLWNRRDEIQELMTQVSHIKCLIEEKRQGGDKLFMKISQTAVELMERLHGYLKIAKPQTVCGTCKGWLDTRGGICKACGSTGLQSIDEYKRFTPIEEQSVRIKAHESTRLSA